MKSLTLVILTLIGPLWLACYMMHFASPNLKFDEFIYVAPMYAHYLDGTLTFHELWAQGPAEHRPFFPKLILLGVGILTHGDMRYVLALSWGLTGLSVWNVWRIVQMTGVNPWLMPLFSLLLANPANCDDYMAGFMICWPLLVALLTAIPLAAASPYRWVLCSGLSVVATFTLAGGCVAWAISGVLCWLNERTK
jgi:hypothetical protein